MSFLARLATSPWTPTAILWLGLVVEWLFFVLVRRPFERRASADRDRVLAEAEKGRLWIVAQNDRLVRRLERLSRGSP